MVEEARLQQTSAGLVPAGPGWFVVNARDARWIERPGRGHNVPLTGWTEHEAQTWFPLLGVNLVVLAPGDPAGTDQSQACAHLPAPFPVAYPGVLPD